MSVSVSLNRLGLPSFDALAAPPMTVACFTDPQIVNLCAYRGDTGRFRLTVTEADGVTPIDLTGATWDADIRRAVDEALVGSFDVEPVVGETNSVDIILTANVSALLSQSPYVYDVEMRMGTEVTTLIAGTLTVTKDVSRPDAPPPWPVLGSVTPTTATVGVPFSLTANGANFQEGANIFIAGIGDVDSIWISATQVMAPNVNITYAGLFTVQIQQPDGRYSNALADAIEVTAP